MKIVVNSEKCPKKHNCFLVKVCPVKAISQENKNALPIIDGEKCIMCKKCVLKCKSKAFEEQK